MSDFALIALSFLLLMACMTVIVLGYRVRSFFVMVGGALLVWLVVITLTLLVAGGAL